MKNPIGSGVVVLALFSWWAGCSDPAPRPSGEAHAHHHHVAPHGGTAVVLGDEAYHLELVRDAAVGKLTAYVLDGEMEKFIRIPANSFSIQAKSSNLVEVLQFQAVGNIATGEKVGDTSQFEATSPWIKSHATFEAVLRSLTIRQSTFTNVVFRFPEGNEHHDH